MIIVVLRTSFQINFRNSYSFDIFYSNVYGKNNLPLEIPKCPENMTSMLWILLSETFYIMGGPFHNNRAGPGEVSVGELELKTMRAGELALLLAIDGWASSGSAGKLPWVVEMRDSWQADQAS